MAARNDPYKNFKFRIEIDQITSAGFSECTGLSTEVDCIDYREVAISFRVSSPDARSTGTSR